MFIKHRFIYLIILTVSVFLGYVVQIQNAQAITVAPVKIELSGDPGTVVGSSLLLINEEDTEQTLYVSYANFEAEGESGTPKFTESNSGLATWIHLIPTELNSVTLTSGSSQTVYFEVTIPEDASPGGYFSAIFWGTSPTNQEDSPELGLGAKIGILVFLSVNGEVSEEGGLVEFAVKDNQQFFTELPIDFYYRFQNDGGDRIVPKGTISLKNILKFGSDEIAANPSESNVLPLDIRRFEVAWGDAASQEVQSFWDHVKAQWNQFAIGYYTVDLALTYGSEQQTALGQTSFWILPWQLLLVIVGSFLIIILILRFIIRSYNRWIISQVLEAQNRAKRTQSSPKKKKL